MKTIQLDVRGMTCEHCAHEVEKAIRTVPGTEHSEIDHRSGLSNAYVRDEVSAEDLVLAINRAGYKARVRVAEHSVDASGSSTEPHVAENGSTRFDLVVIGTGAAGVAAAIRAAELGRRVAIVEASTIGGTCVNVGCIPSKNLIAAADRYHNSGEGFPGVGSCRPSIRWREIQEQKNALVDALRSAKYVEVLQSYPEITLLRGRARLLGAGAVEVGGVRTHAAKIILATGTQPWVPPIDGVDTVEILDSTTVMELEQLPQSMIVLGGNTVGLELAQMFARLGVRVTVLELMPTILAGEDADIAEELRAKLCGEGIEIRTNAHATRIEGHGESVVVHASIGGREEIIRAERLMAATGRRPDVRGLGLEEAGVELDERGFIRVASTMRTANPDIFAAGDVTGGPGFVYVAAAGGRVAAENALTGSSRDLDLTAVPRVTFTSPQVAAVGMSESEALSRGIEIEVSRLGLEHVPRALVEHKASGWIRVVAEKATGRILGVSAVGPNAGELLGEATLAVRLGLTSEQLADTLHPYLTWVEGLRLAAQSFRMDVSKLSCCA